jgi:hypothetical protein
LTAITSDMAAIWGRCENYASTGEFAAFIRACAHEPDTLYIAFRDETVESIRDVIALRRDAQTSADAGSAEPLAPTPVPPAHRPGIPAAHTRASARN